MHAQDMMPDAEAIGEIRAELERYRAERARTRRSAWWRVAVFDGLVLAAVVLLALLFNRFADPREQWLSAPHLFLYLLGLAVLVVGHVVWRRRPARHEQSLRASIMPKIFSFIEDIRYRRGVTPASFARLPREAVESFDRERFDDVISGRHEDFSFEFYEAVLSEGSGDTRSEVFRGVVVAFGTITRFPGLLVAAHRTDKASVGFLRGLFGDRLEELKSGVAALDEIYEFRSDNPDAARPLVTGKLARALEWLGETWPESPARLALREGDGFLLIPLARNLFELPADGEPIDYTAHVEPMIADLAALLATAALVRKAGSADPKTE